MDQIYQVNLIDKSILRQDSSQNTFNTKEVHPSSITEELSKDVNFILYCFKRNWFIDWEYISEEIKNDKLTIKLILSELNKTINHNTLRIRATTYNAYTSHNIYKHISSNLRRDIEINELVMSYFEWRNVADFDISIKDNKSFILNNFEDFYQLSKSNYLSLSDRLKEDEDIIFHFRISEYEILPEKYKLDSNFLCKLMGDMHPFQATRFFKKIPEEIRYNRKLLINYAAKILKRDDYKNIPEEFWKDKDFVLSVIELSQGKGTGLWLLKMLPDCMKRDRDIILAAVKLDGRFLRDVYVHFKRDKEIVIEAIKQYPHAYQFASKELRNDREIALLYTSLDGDGFDNLPQKFKNDQEICLNAAINQDLYNLFKFEALLTRDFLIEVLKRKRTEYVWGKYYTEKFEHDRELAVRFPKNPRSDNPMMYLDYRTKEKMRLV